MSDKLEKCACGGDGEFLLGGYISCTECTLQTTNRLTNNTHDGVVLLTEDEAIYEWQTMQRALKSGWSSEVPTEEGHYMFIGSYEGRFENVVLTAPVYAKLSMAYTDETGKTPDGVVARINGFTGWPDQFNGLWFRINYPDPPKD